MGKYPFELVLSGNEIMWRHKESQSQIAIKRGNNWKVCVKILDDTEWADEKKNLLQAIIELLKEQPDAPQSVLSNFSNQYYTNLIFSTQKDFE